MRGRSGVRGRIARIYAARLRALEDSGRARTKARFLPSPAAAIALIIALTVAFAIALLRPQPAIDPTPARESVAMMSPSQSASPEVSTAPQTLVVQVSGAVHAPGVVEVPAGSRGTVAVEQAGGLRDEADLASVNLAAPVVDGQHIHVRAVGEAAAIGQASATCVDIRVADTSQLQALAGIGPALAQRIIDHRANHPFSNPEDVRAVRGIGAKTFERFKDQLCP